MDWEAQWKQLKTELDALNPKYDAAVARIKELEATLALREKEKAEAETARDVAQTACVQKDAEIGQWKGQVDKDAQAMAEQVRRNVETSKELTAQKARADKLLAALNAANAAFAPAAKAITEALHASV